MKTADTKLRQFLKNAENDINETPKSQHPSMSDFISCNSKWQYEDIVHYLRTEQDPVRLARWCELYLEQDY